ncbi:MAG: hypothetical protein JNK15_03715 [Planctomycetes bacterium]|nr:hypothetical protein [Planctomycetota bacterium]
MPTTPPTRRERSLHEAAQFGAAVIAVLIAGTLAQVLALLLGAGVLRLYAHFAGDAT